MAHRVTLRTTRFDPEAEPVSPINPIAGLALLVWLGAALRAAGFESGEPDAEGRGWYRDVSCQGAKYLVGASGEAEPGDKGATGRSRSTGIGRSPTRSWVATRRPPTTL